MKKLFISIMILVLIMVPILTACNTTSTTSSTVTSTVTTTSTTTTPVNVTTTVTTSTPEVLIKIGASAPLTGSTASAGISCRNVLNYYIDKINAAGGQLINGTRYKYQLIIADDQYVASMAVANVNRFINQDKVDYVVMVGGGMTMAIDPIVTQAKIVTFTSGGGDCIGAKYPYTFRTNVDDFGGQFGVAITTIKESANHDTVVIVNPDDATGHGYADHETTIWTNLGVKVLDTPFYTRGTVDFMPLMTSVMAKKPDIISLAVAPESDVPLETKAARDLGYKGLFPEGSGVSDILKIEGVLGMGSIPGAPGEAQPQTELREYYIAKYGQLDNWWEFWGNYFYAFFNQIVVDAGSAKTEAVYAQLTKPGYKFNTWWGESYFFGANVPRWGLDRQIAAPVPVSMVKNGEWTQANFVKSDDLIPLYEKLLTK